MFVNKIRMTGHKIINALSSNFLSNKRNKRVRVDRPRKSNVGTLLKNNKNGTNTGTVRYGNVLTITIRSKDRVMFRDNTPSLGVFV